jgi:lipopolysaccharide/colanic/teichoic acid biosynthesis glycosyltransferase
VSGKSATTQVERVVSKQLSETQGVATMSAADRLAVPAQQPPSRAWRKGDLARAREQRRAQLHVLGPSLFRSALIRERKSADRSNQPFALLLVTIRDQRPFDSSKWDLVVAALAAARRDTDVLGWLEPGAAIGAIIPLIDTQSDTLRQIETRLLREIARLDASTALRLSIRVHLHQPAERGAEATSSAVDPVLARIRPRSPGARINEAMKRALDLGGSLTLLALLSPVFVILAAAVKLTSKGPVFFKQERIGQSSRPFKMLKFRSMRANNDATIHQKFVTDFINAGSKPQASESGEAKVYKITGDPRVTPLGRFIRKTSLDELPQLWNVVRGEMSLVGPRPPLPYEVEQYKAWHCRRIMEAKPGITGLWQVSGRSRTTFDEMVRLDLRYAKSSSPWMDVKILLATPRAVISGKGAC